MRCILFDPAKELDRVVAFLKEYGFGIYDTYNHEDFSDALENMPANIVIATDAISKSDAGFDAEHALKTHKFFVATQGVEDDREYFYITDQKKLIDLDFVHEYSRKSIEQLKAKVLELYKGRLRYNSNNSGNVISLKPR